MAALQNGVRVLARKGQHAICPECGTEVLAKCGEINIWHWAHVRLVDCDFWGEPESAWHLNWKSGLPLDWVEVLMLENGEKHRADIRLPNGRVIELQHSSISVAEIGKREQFYKRMIWIFDVAKAASTSIYGDVSDEEAGYYSEIDSDDFLDTFRLDLRDRGDGTNYRTFRWRHAKKHIAFATKPVFLDLGNNQILHLKKMYPEPPVGGWGLLYPKSKLVDQITTGKL